MFKNITTEKINSISNPAVSVIVPVYNDAKYIKDCLDSILAQNDVVMEVLVLENGSTDNSWELINSYQDERISKYRCPINLSAARASLYLATQAKGKYLRLFNADDRMLPGSLKNILDFATSSNTDLVFASMKTMKDNGQVNTKDILEPEDLPDLSEFIRYALYMRNPYSYPTALIKKELFTFENIDFRFAALLDLALWTKLRIDNRSVKVLKEPTVAYRLRKSGGNYSSFGDQSRKRERFLEKMLFFDYVLENLNQDQIINYLTKFSKLPLVQPQDIKHARFLFSQSILTDKTYFKDFDLDIHEMFFAYKALSNFDFRQFNTDRDLTTDPFRKKSDSIYAYMSNFKLKMVGKYINMLLFYLKRNGLRGTINRVLGHLFR